MASAEPSTTQRLPRWRPGPGLSISNLPIRRKVTLVILAPLALAAILATTSVLTSKSSYDRSQHSAAQVALIGPATRYQAAIERTAVVSQLVNEFSDATFRAQAVQVRARSQELAEAAKAPGLTDEVTTHVNRLLELTAKAQDGDGFESLDNALRMTDLASSEVSALLVIIAADMQTPEPQLDMVHAAVQARLALTKQQSIMGSTNVLPRDVASLFAQLGAENLLLTQLVEQADAQDRREHAAKLRFLLNANEQRSLTAATGLAPGITSRTTEPFDQLIPSLLTELNEHLAQKAADASRNAWLTLLAASLSLGLAVVLAAMVARRIVRSIAQVHDETLAVAAERLPEAVRRIRAGEDPGTVVPLTVATTDETGQLARAVDSLHQQAVSLAVEEAQVRARVADMFTTLSRRNTSLINQQLGVIETLERDEQDPDRLEHLFRLDHLAARMRRNAQSLVILADAPVRNVDPTPISVNEAVMAALGGVQEYRRVQLLPNAPDMIDGVAAADIVHVVTELLDNALSYSPPTTSVEVTTERRGNGVRVIITDAGLGMKPQDLARAQQSLRSNGEVSSETARRMGLFVVSRLAHQHGLEVHLVTNQLGGITATVDIPSTVLVSADEPADEALSVSETGLSEADADTEPVALDVEPVAWDAEPVVLDAEPVALDVEPEPVALDAEPVALDVEPEPVVLDAEPVAWDAEPVALDAEPVAWDDHRESLDALDAELAALIAEPTAPDMADAAEQTESETTLAVSTAVAAVTGEELQHAAQEGGSGASTATEAWDVSSASPLESPQPQPAGVLTSAGDVAHIEARTDSTTFERVRHEVTEVAQNVALDAVSDSEAPTPSPVVDATAAPAAPTLRAAKRQEPVRTASGLPIRQRGERPVPGSLQGTTEQPSIGRDAEALRARLSAHVAGVSRGRQTVSPNTDT